MKFGDKTASSILTPYTQRHLGRGTTTTTTTTKQSCCSSPLRSILALLLPPYFPPDLFFECIQGETQKEKALCVCDDVFLQGVGEELVQFGNLGGDGEVDGSVADLDDEPTQDVGVHLVPDLQPLALAVLGLGDGALEAAEGLVVQLLCRGDVVLVGGVEKGKREKEKINLYHVSMFLYHVWDVGGESFIIPEHS